MYINTLSVSIISLILSCRNDLSLAVSPPPIVPTMPVDGQFPDPDELVMINQTYLNDPMVTNGLAYVQSVVSADLLNIPPSQYILFGNVNYIGNASANCYWQFNQCVRTTTGAWGPPDIIACPNKYDWGLAYDDAPISNLVGTNHYNDTVTLLALLDKVNVKATFFVTGSQATYFSPVLQSMAADNHHIASHTWTHHPLTSLTNAQIVAELLYTSAIIYNLTSLNPIYFRPPYGDIDDRVRAIINALGYHVVLWGRGYDSGDSDVTPNSTNYQPILNAIDGWFNTQPGFISLQHTISTFVNGIAEAALNQIIAMGGIKNQIQTVPQCLGDIQWYKNKNITTKYNTCTIPGGCNGTSASASPTMAPVQTQAAVNSTNGVSSSEASLSTLILMLLWSVLLV
jgi:hypothetical protein